MKRIALILVLSVLMLPAGWAQAATLTWDGTGSGGTGDGAGVWDTASKWWNGSIDTTWTSGSDAVFGHGAAGGAVTLANPTTVNSILMSGFTGTYTLGTAGKTITLNNGITMNVGAQALTFASPITLGAAQTWINGTTSTLTPNANVNNGGFLLTIDGSGPVTFGAVTISGGGGITKNGTGTLSIRSSANSYTGPTTINAGTVAYNNSASLPGGNLVLNGGALESNAADTFNRTLGTGAGQVQVTGGTVGFSVYGIANMNLERAVRSHAARVNCSF